MLLGGEQPGDVPVQLTEGPGRVASAASCCASGEFAPNTFGISEVLSSSMLAVATSPTSQPARVNGTQGAGVSVSGVTGVFAVAGGTGE